jgi:hypothetical protein
MPKTLTDRDETPYTAEQPPDPAEQRHARLVLTAALYPDPQLRLLDHYPSRRDVLIASAVKGAVG